MKLQVTVVAVISLFTVTLLPISAVAATWSGDTRVTYINAFKTGAIYVQLDTSVDEGNCASRELYLDPESSNKDAILKIATAALLAGSTVTVRVKGCFSGTYPIIDRFTLK